VASSLCVAQEGALHCRWSRKWTEVRGGVAACQPVTEALSVEGAKSVAARVDPDGLCAPLRSGILSCVKEILQMSLRLLIALMAVLMLTAAVGCARRPEAPEAVPAVAPLPDTGETAQPAETEATAAAEGQELYESKCAHCHTLDRVEKHDPAKEPWPEIVEDMQGKKSGWISDEDAAAIVQHLEDTYGTP
jgi:mono/diheme cytochrome c family protein